jgi:hypothetical protein
MESFEEMDEPDFKIWRERVGSWNKRKELDDLKRSDHVKRSHSPCGLG